MSPVRKKRIGLIGFGGIGKEIHRRIAEHPALEPAFVYNRTQEAMQGIVKQDLQITHLAAMKDHQADLVVEMAHPSITAQWGASILRTASYLPLSVTALADDVLRESLIDIAQSSGTSLAIPHGALMGLDSLFEWRHAWEAVTITFIKPPGSIDFSDSGMAAPLAMAPTVLYDGAVRGIAKLFPRNVNTMVTCALATVGLDRCRARLVVDPDLARVVAEVEAVGADGSMLRMRKEQPAIGVSGTEMVESQFASIVRAAGLDRQAMRFV